MEDAADARRPTRLVLGGVALFLLAVVLARMLLAGGAGWLAFAVCVPVLLVVLTARASLSFALAGTALFAVAVLALREFLRHSPTGWVALLLLPVVAVTALLVGRVLAQLRAPAEAEADADAGGDDVQERVEREGEEGAGP